MIGLVVELHELGCSLLPGVDLFGTKLHRVAASWSLGWGAMGKTCTVIPEIETCVIYLTFNFIDN